MPVVLREYRPEDFDALYDHQADPEFAAMVGMPSRDREAYAERVRLNVADADNVYRVIEVDGEVVGSCSTFLFEGHREVGYGIGREHWGKGYATEALHALLAEDARRPLHAGAAAHNVASARVLAKCGFIPDGVAESDGFHLFVLRW